MRREFTLAFTAVFLAPAPTPRTGMGFVILLFALAFAFDFGWLFTCFEQNVLLCCQKTISESGFIENHDFDATFGKNVWIEIYLRDGLRDGAAGVDLGLDNRLRAGFWLRNRFATRNRTADDRFWCSYLKRGSATSNRFRNLWQCLLRWGFFLGLIFFDLGGRRGCVLSDELLILHFWWRNNLFTIKFESFRSHEYRKSCSNLTL